MATCKTIPSRTPLDASSMYMRALPEALPALSSPAGKRLFAEALADGGMAGYFRLAQQFHTQADPAYCGLGSLVCALNALGIDPARSWKGPWRWFTEEMLDCCKPLDDVKHSGLTLEEVACLARCAGADVSVHTAAPAAQQAFREHLRGSAFAEDGPVLLVNYSRRALEQTGDGHFSPIAGYHAGEDRALVLDTARFKYPPHWVPVERLFGAMQAADPATGAARGWLLLRAPG
ncbi:MAG TPA: phytochelatin synthase family protein [Gammaproteobacteria bacterium]|nr:phytochelatin synthase family protein [Gammaproteobacteria bacterium]